MCKMRFIVAIALFTVALPVAIAGDVDTIEEKYIYKDSETQIHTSWCGEEDIMLSCTYAAKKVCKEKDIIVIRHYTDIDFKNKVDYTCSND